MLRIIRGAGKPNALLKQMSDVVAAAAKCEDVTGQLPIGILKVVLHGENEAQPSKRGDEPGKSTKPRLNGGTKMALSRRLRLGTA
jgi:hypothetical protein